MAEPRYLSACTRATTVFAILTVFFAAKLGLAFFSAGAILTGIVPAGRLAKAEFVAARGLWQVGIVIMDCRCAHEGTAICANAPTLKWPVSVESKCGAVTLG